jgi:glycosyltransferase involved in cell wall biosynthesis
MHRAPDKMSDSTKTRTSQDYKVFNKIPKRYHGKISVVICAGISKLVDEILKTTGYHKLYVIDSRSNNENYDDPMNINQNAFDESYESISERVQDCENSRVCFRKHCHETVKEIEEQINFLFIDHTHSYENISDELCLWLPKIKAGGAMGGHYYGHPDFPAVKQTVDQLFGRFSWTINVEDDYVWWVEKRSLSISFFIPAYNCATTINEAVDSIFDGNFEDGDELVICNDSSTDNTRETLLRLKQKYSIIQIVDHETNKGGGAARNTAIENTKNSLLFCLDSDNILAPDSVPKLKKFLLASGADVAAFGEMHYFREKKDNVTLKWFFRPETTLADYLAGQVVPGASGNYLFTKESWHRAGGYPDFSGALDAWGFGFRQLATGSKMMAMAHSFYFHRHGHDSYWIREKKKGKISLTALQIIIPHVDLIEPEDVNYIFSEEGRNDWFNNLKYRALRVKNSPKGECGKRIYYDNDLSKYILKSVKNKIKDIFWT